MGSLSNLYISSSFQSLLHFGSDNTASVNLTEIQDGFGNGLGFYLNSIGSASLDGDLTVGGDFIVSGTFDIEGKVTINDNVRVNGNLEVSGSTNITGGLVVTNDITASNINVLGTLTATKLVTIIESASVIFSSGSNILGDATNDTQTLIGSVIISGSEALTGSMGISGDLNVGGSGSFGTNLKVYCEISSSTINGIGNVTTYSASVQSFVNSVSSSISGTITTLSQSVDSRLDFLEGPFSTSVDARLDELENWSSSLQTNFVTTAELTQTASFLQNQINQKLNTSSFNSYTQSTAATIATLATTGSNNFVGNQTITGSLTISSSAAVELNVMGNSTFSGSVRGQVIALSVVSQTASMDLSLGNFFTLTLPTASVTYLNPTNIQPGETVQLLVSQQSVTGSLNYSSVLLFPTGSQYSASVFANSQDVLSFVTFNTASIYAVSIKNLV
jgi:hypothetical protein